jgi:hypothetical protein
LKLWIQGDSRNAFKTCGKEIMEKNTGKNQEILLKCDMEKILIIPHHGSI